MQVNSGKIKKKPTTTYCKIEITIIKTKIYNIIYPSTPHGEKYFFKYEISKIVTKQEFNKNDSSD